MPAQAQEVADFALWVARLDTLAQAGAAGDTQGLLDLLNAEVTSPIPTDLPHWPSD